MDDIENFYRCLDNLYHQDGNNKAKGFVSATQDHAFKRLTIDCPDFLIFFITESLGLSPGSTITKLIHENTEMVPIDFKDKVYRADVLVRIWIESDDPNLNGPSLVNIEVHHSSPPLYTVKKFTAYACRLYGNQVRKGRQKGYEAVKNVYSIVIVKDKLSYFQDIDSYHHTHTYGVKNRPDLGLSMPGPHYTIVELGKFKIPYENLNTPREKLYYFIQKADKLLMSRHVAESYYKEGGPMSEAIFKMAQYSQADHYKKFLEEREQERADRKRFAAEIAAESEAIGLGKGRKEGKAEGKAEAKTELAQNLIADGFNHDKIAQLTGLSLSDIKAINLNAS